MKTQGIVFSGGAPTEVWIFCACGMSNTACPPAVMTCPGCGVALDIRKRGRRWIAERVEES